MPGKHARALLPPWGAADWGRVPEAVRATVLRAAEDLHGAEAGAPTASDWMRYRTLGDRVVYETKLTLLEDRLATATLVACLAQGEEDRALWVERAADDAWSLCELSSWCLPAHYAALVDPVEGREPELPDPLHPGLDLSAAFLGAQLAWTRHLLRGELQQRYPTLHRRIGREIEQRVLRPFLERDHWWFGSQEQPPNNWAPWITANTLACALTTAEPAEQRAVVDRALPILDNFCAGYGEDGSCEEGATYWWWAAATLFEALEFIGAITEGSTEALHRSPVPAMSGFPSAMQIHDRWQVNFGDASALSDRGVRWHTAYRYAEAVGNRDAAQHARAMARLTGQSDPLRWTVPRPVGNTFHRVASEVLDERWFSAEAQTDPGPAEGMPYPATIYLPHTEVLCARERAGSSEGLYLAVKGGHNGVSHNHNDAGNFLVFHDGKPVVIDVGVGTYRKETFDGARRYDIWTMRSGFHNVPLIDGQEQAAGAEYRATECVAFGLSASDGATNLLPEETGLELHLEQAYPRIHGLESWQRRVSLDRAQRCIRVRDCWTSGVIPAELMLMVAHRPERLADGGLRLGGTTLRVSPGWVSSWEQITLDDARLSDVWGEVVYRLRLVADPEGRLESGPVGSLESGEAKGFCEMTFGA
ncbi:heparinase II/III domain-containing protein [Psychromicrobium xiongbiense]|uniref:heparinase II/III domain-containing protein n=1 Tax=Psychromicrobium xiongbiense TaxID=3051184 RepID=UPI0025522AEB|nr:heparinase II/III family protein [Psychromicrobium sp. YIM S02556]